MSSGSAGCFVAGQLLLRFKFSTSRVGLIVFTVAAIYVFSTHWKNASSRFGRRLTIQGPMANR